MSPAMSPATSRTARPGARRLAVAALLVAALSACGPATGERTLTVFAAASLTEVVTSLERRFERTHDVDVRVNLGGSSRLARQITEGAEADVFASADERAVGELAREGLLDGPVTPFATNTLTIAVPRGNPARVTGLADLADPDRTVVVCAPTVPCGAAADRVERRAGVTLRPDSEELDVRAVLTKVELGEADAGLVYVTDVAASDRVERVPLADDVNVVNTYPVAVLADPAAPELAREFRALLLSGDGRRLLSEAGFGRPG